MQLRALFLDRDGVINQNHGYVCEQANFDFIDGIFDVVLYAQKLKYKLIVITNQAGIGRGYYSEDQFHNLSRWMCEQFEVAGSPISKVYFSQYKRCRSSYQAEMLAEDIEDARQDIIELQIIINEIYQSKKLAEVQL